MKIEWIKLRGYRNFENAKIVFNKKTLIIGANDVGKTNLLNGIRLLLDRTISESQLEPIESDFHINHNGSQVKSFEIIIKLSEIIEDAVLSKLKGFINDMGESFLKYCANIDDLCYNFFIGHIEKNLVKIESRSYLKYIHLLYMQSTRDLSNIIRSDKKQLLKLSRESRDDCLLQKDALIEKQIKNDIVHLNKSVGDLSYISESTNELNIELKKLAYHNFDYSVNLESNSINFNTFIDQLTLGAKTGEKNIGLGGDGRNNQLLMALWKVKNEKAHDLKSEVIIYCIEEPESHLHPHQQRKISEYLINMLQGQVIVTTHSPQITAEFKPDSIIRLIRKNGKTSAASKGCSKCVEESWQAMSYRMSIIPAEAFFADSVLLVEGPSEVQFYNELASQLNIDLDYLNISILSVDGIDFTTYINILDAMEIPWSVRTDNDIAKVQKSNPEQWNFSGLNRALKICNEKKIEYFDHRPTDDENMNQFVNTSKIVNRHGVFVSKIDLENDLGQVCGGELLRYADTDDLKDAIKYMQDRKAIRMCEFLRKYNASLKKLKTDELAKPLVYCTKKAKERIGKKRRRMKTH